MINKETKDYVVESMLEDTSRRFKENLADLDLEGFMAQGNVNLVREAVNKIKSNVIASIPEGIPVPPASLYVSCSGEDEVISIINISVSNKVNSVKKFKFQNSFTNNNVVDNIAEFFRSTYLDLVIDLLVEDNLEYINEVIAEAAEKAEIPFKVSFVSEIKPTNRKIAFISDDEIEFIVDPERVFDEDILALQEPSEFISEESIEAAKQQVVDSLSSAQTPAQLVAERGGLFIGYLANIGKNVKPMTLLKQVTSRNIENLKGNKDALCYFSKDNVFALVAKRDGNLEVILSPINIETLHTEDVDVLKELEK